MDDSSPSIAVKRVKVISFDLDDTIFESEPVLKRANEKLDAYLSDVEGLHPARLAPKLSWKQASLRDPHKAHDVTHVRRIILHAQTKPAVSDFEARDALVDRAMEHFLTHRADVAEHVYPEVYATLEALRDTHSLGLGSITNGNAQVHRIPELAEFFRVTVSATTAGAAKPSSLPFAEFFALAQAEYGVTSPDEILHVGDNFHADVVGASDFGMRTALVEPLAKDRTEVRSSVRPDVFPDVVVPSVGSLFLERVLESFI